MVDIDKMQYGFMPGRGTVDAVFILRRLKEKFRAKISCFLYLLTWKILFRLLCGESLNEFMDKYERWKNAVERKILRVNVDKKGMQLLFGKKKNVSKVDPCGVCGEQVGCNSI